MGFSYMWTGRNVAPFISQVLYSLIVFYKGFGKIRKIFSTLITITLKTMS